MAQIPLINGIYADAGAADFRTSYPRNMVPVPKQTGISQGYLRPAEGIVQRGGATPGVDRGGINWNGTEYRVLGTSLCQLDKDGAVSVLGDVGGSGQVSMDYSFDRLGIASGGKLWFFEVSWAAPQQVTDPDLGDVIFVLWVAGYWMTSDGTSVIVTDLSDPFAVNPLHYGSAEADPDRINSLGELRNEAYIFGRYTVQVQQNVGGTGYPFQTIPGAQVGKGTLGTFACCSLGDTFIFAGSGRGEAPGVYQMIPGNVQKVSTREIDAILAGYTDDELATIVMETRVQQHHQHVYIHLPDQTLVYDTIGSATAGEQLWFTLTSGTGSMGAYRARNFVWCYGQWNCGDPTSAVVGALSDDVSTHYGDVSSWEFGVMALYSNGNGAIINEFELVALAGRVALGANPVIWTSYSTDGVTWSQERIAYAGKQGQRNKRIIWRTQGTMKHWRIQKFRGTSDAHLAFARLEAQFEPLFSKGPPRG